METRVIQLRGRGTLTLPAKIRERYSLADGDPVTVVDLDGVILIAPKVGVVPKIQAEITRIRKEAGLEVEDLLEGLSGQRERSLRERRGRA